MTDPTYLQLPPLLNKAIKMIDSGLTLLPRISKAKLEREEYQIADHDAAKWRYAHYMARFKNNMNDLANNWQGIAVNLGKQIQIDLRNGLHLDDIMPQIATTVGANLETDKRPSQIYDIVAGPRRSAVTGEFINMVQFLISTSVHGPEIYHWYNRNRPANSRHDLEAPLF